VIGGITAAIEEAGIHSAILLRCCRQWDIPRRCQRMPANTPFTAGALRSK